MLAQFWMILSPNNPWRKIVFLSHARHYEQKLIVVIVHYYQIWNKKEHKIINTWVISSQMDFMYIEILHIYIYIYIYIYCHPQTDSFVVSHTHTHTHTHIYIYIYIYMIVYWVTLYWKKRNENASAWFV